MTGNSGLTEAYCYILFALVEPLHGYGIMQKVEELSDGTYSLGPGTLYTALTNMRKRKWIEPWGEESGRRKNYRLTELGRKKVNEELKRIQLLKTAAEKTVRLLQQEQNP